MNHLFARLLVRIAPLWCAKQAAADGEHVFMWNAGRGWFCRIGTRRHAVTASTPRKALLLALAKAPRRVQQPKATADSKAEKGTP